MESKDKEVELQQRKSDSACWRGAQVNHKRHQRNTRRSLSLIGRQFVCWFKGPDAPATTTDYPAIITEANLIAASDNAVVGKPHVGAAIQLLRSNENEKYDGFEYFRVQFENGVEGRLKGSTIRELLRATYFQDLLKRFALENNKRKASSIQSEAASFEGSLVDDRSETLEAILGRRILLNYNKGFETNGGLECSSAVVLEYFWFGAQWMCLCLNDEGKFFRHSAAFILHLAELTTTEALQQYIKALKFKLNRAITSGQMSGGDLEKIAFAALVCSRTIKTIDDELNKGISAVASSHENRVEWVWKMSDQVETQSIPKSLSQVQKKQQLQLLFKRIEQDHAFDQQDQQDGPSGITPPHEVATYVSDADRKVQSPFQVKPNSLLSPNPEDASAQFMEEDILRQLQSTPPTQFSPPLHELQYATASDGLRDDEIGADMEVAIDNFFDHEIGSVQRETSSVAAVATTTAFENDSEKCATATNGSLDYSDTNLSETEESSVAAIDDIKSEKLGTNEEVKSAADADDTHDDSSAMKVSSVNFPLNYCTFNTRARLSVCAECKKAGRTVQECRCNLRHHSNNWNYVVGQQIAITWADVLTDEVLDSLSRMWDYCKDHKCVSANRSDVGLDGGDANRRSRNQNRPADKITSFNQAGDYCTLSNCTKMSVCRECKAAGKSLLFCRVQSNHRGANWGSGRAGGNMDVWALSDESLCVLEKLIAFCQATGKNFCTRSDIGVRDPPPSAIKRSASLPLLGQVENSSHDDRREENLPPSVNSAHDNRAVRTTSAENSRPSDKVTSLNYADNYCTFSNLTRLALCTVCKRNGGNLRQCRIELRHSSANWNFKPTAHINQSWFISEDVCNQLEEFFVFCEENDTDFATRAEVYDPHQIFCKKFSESERVAAVESDDESSDVDDSETVRYHRSGRVSLQGPRPWSDSEQAVVTLKFVVNGLDQETLQMDPGLSEIGATPEVNDGGMAKSLKRVSSSSSIRSDGALYDKKRTRDESESSTRRPQRLTAKSRVSSTEIGAIPEETEESHADASPAKVGRSNGTSTSSAMPVIRPVDTACVLSEFAEVVRLYPDPFPLNDIPSSEAAVSAEPSSTNFDEFYKKQLCQWAEVFNKNQEIFDLLSYRSAQSLTSPRVTSSPPLSVRKSVTDADTTTPSFKDKDKDKYASLFTRIRNYVLIRNRLVPAYSACVSEAATKLDPLAQLLSDDQVGFLRLKDLHHTIAKELHVNFLRNTQIVDSSMRSDFKSLESIPSTNYSTNLGSLENTNHKIDITLRDMLESVDTRVETMWQLQRANEVIIREHNKRQEELAQVQKFGRTLTDANELVHNQIQECEYERKRLEHLRNDELRELEEQERALLAQLEQVREAQRANRRQVQQDNVDVDNKVEQLKAKLKHMADLQTRCGATITKCTSLLDLTRYFGDYVDSLCGIVIDLEKCAASSSAVLSALFGSSKTSAVNDSENLGPWISVLSRIAGIIEAVIKTPCTTKEGCENGLHINVALANSNEAVYSSLSMWNCCEKRRLLHEGLVVAYNLVCQSNRHNQSALMSNFDSSNREVLVQLSDLFLKAADSIALCRTCNKQSFSGEEVHAGRDDTSDEDQQGRKVLVLCDPRTIMHMVPPNLHERSTRIVRIMNRLVRLQSISERCALNVMKPTRGRPPKHKQHLFSQAVPISSTTTSEETEVGSGTNNPSNSSGAMVRTLKCLHVNESQVEPTLLWNCIKLAHADSYIQFIQNRCLTASATASNSPTGRRFSVLLEGCCITSGPYCCLQFKEAHLRLPSREVTAVKMLDREMRADGLIRFPDDGNNVDSDQDTVDANLPKRGVKKATNANTDRYATGSTLSGSVPGDTVSDADSFQPKLRYPNKAHSGMARTSSTRSFASLDSAMAGFPGLEELVNSAQQTTAFGPELQQTEDYFMLCGDCCDDNYSKLQGPGFWEELEEDSADTYLSPESFTAAVAAASVVCHAIDAVLSGTFTGMTFKPVKVDLPVEGPSAVANLDDAAVDETEQMSELNSLTTGNVSSSSNTANTSRKRGRPRSKARVSTASANPEPAGDDNVNAADAENTGVTDPLESNAGETTGYLHYKQYRTFTPAQIAAAGEKIARLRTGALVDVDRQLNEKHFVRDTIWDANFEALLDYGMKAGHCNMPGSHIVDVNAEKQNFPLGNWLKNQREYLRHFTLPVRRYLKFKILADAGLFSFGYSRTGSNIYNDCLVYYQNILSGKSSTNVTANIGKSSAEAFTSGEDALLVDAQPMQVDANIDGNDGIQGNVIAENHEAGTEDHDDKRVAPENEEGSFEEASDDESEGVDMNDSGLLQKRRRLEVGDVTSSEGAISKSQCSAVHDNVESISVPVDDPSAEADSPSTSEIQESDFKPEAGKLSPPDNPEEPAELTTPVSPVEPTDLTAVVTGIDSVFCCIRPPGHHAGRFGSTPGCTQNGFCLLNNVAIGVYYARAKYGLRRVAIVDIDAHFGNGTLDIFQNDSALLYASIHLESHTGGEPFFPSTFSLKQGVDCVSSNRVLVNIKPSRRYGQYLPSQQPGFQGKHVGVNRLRGRAGYLYAVTNIVIPALKRFQPELLLISAGFDGAQTDPIGGALGLTTMDYYNITRELRLAAKDISQGKPQPVRIVSVLEGGYDVSASDGLSACVEAHVRGLCDA